MSLITKDTDYAIRALCFIAKNKGEIVSVRGLVSELKIPGPFLRKILQKLNKKGVLKSYKGKGGGFMLADAPRNISVADLIGAFQGPIKLQEHFFKKGACPNVKRCLLKKKIDEIEKFAVSTLNSIAITALLKNI